MKTRLSLGSAVLLGLKSAPCDVLPTTVYLMLGENCAGNCAFCTQARESKSRETDLLSRVVWPEFPLEEIARAMAEHKGEFQRICLQCLNYPQLAGDIMELLLDIRKAGVRVPVSVSSVPVSRSAMLQFQGLGADRMSFALDGTTSELFDRVKGKERDGPFSWEEVRAALRESVAVFGSSFTHLIIGLGETDQEALALISELKGEGVLCSLFAFTPSRKEGGQGPDPTRYHSLQLALRLLYRGLLHREDLKFNPDGSLWTLGISHSKLLKLLDSGEAPWLDSVFNTFGCPGCNRPFYNERPKGPFYNHPKNPGRELVLETLSRLEAREII